MFFHVCLIIYVKLNNSMKFRIHLAGVAVFSSLIILAHSKNTFLMPSKLIKESTLTKQHLSTNRKLSEIKHVTFSNVVPLKDHFLYDRSDSIHHQCCSIKTANQVNYFADLNLDEIDAYKLNIWQQIADLSLIPPKINTSPLPDYDYDKLDYGMTLGIARTPLGRLWALWVAGEDGPNAFMVAATSDDDGKSWSKPCLVVDSQSSTLPLPRSVIIGNFWTDPFDRLWFFFDQTMDHYDGRQGVWASVCENPDSNNPIWSKPIRICHGAVLNKPTVLSNGEWLLPVEFPLINAINENLGFVHRHLESFRGANVYVSKNYGKSWVLRGNVRFPNPNWDEHMFVELKDGRIWMLARTKNGTMQTFSSDRGRTWEKPSYPTFKHPVARFHIRRLQSGRILLIKHGETIDTHEGRSKLSAWLSEDEGVTWKGGLMLDERNGVSYPDGFQAPDGKIYVSYDRERSKLGEILMAQITEEDILEGKLVNPDSELKMLISKPLKSSNHSIK